MKKTKPCKRAWRIPTIENLKAIVDDVIKQGADTSSERIQSELKELHRRPFKLECHNRRGNMTYFGIK